MTQIEAALGAVATERSITIADREGAARRLAAVVDGLGLQLLVGMIDHARAAGLIREAVANELGFEVAPG
jgi:hypothetical protein